MPFLSQLMSFETIRPVVIDQIDGDRGPMIPACWNRGSDASASFGGKPTTTRVFILFTLLRRALLGIWFFFFIERVIKWIEKDKNLAGEYGREASCFEAGLLVLLKKSFRATLSSREDERWLLIFLTRP